LFSKGEVAAFVATVGTTLIELGECES